MSSGQNSAPIGTGVNTGVSTRGVSIGQGTVPVAVVPPGTAAQVLTSNGASADPTFQDAPSGSGPVTQARVALSSAQLLSLFSSPVPIIAAPGAGKAIIIIQVVYSLTFGTTAYTGGGTAALRYGTDVTGLLAESSSSVAPNAFKAAAVSTLTLDLTSIGTSARAASLVNNMPITLVQATSDFTGGDGTGSVTVDYVTVTL